MGKTRRRSIRGKKVKLDKEEHLSRLLAIINDKKNDYSIKDSEIHTFKKVMLNIDSELGGKRYGKLFLYYPLSQGENCEHYMDAIGGEVVKFNKKAFPQIYDMLADVGTPISIIAKVPFKSLIGYSQERFINNLIRKVLLFEDKRVVLNDGIRDELILETKLERENIIEIIVNP